MPRFGAISSDYGCVAQSEERHPVKVEVAGSKPVVVANNLKVLRTFEQVPQSTLWEVSQASWDSPIVHLRGVV